MSAESDAPSGDRGQASLSPSPMAVVAHLRIYV
jgi:hypothetical protein